jgi:hypothetical protein
MEQSKRGTTAITEMVEMGPNHCISSTAPNGCRESETESKKDAQSDVDIGGSRVKDV